MDFENTALGDRNLNIQIYHPENLSTSFAIEVESKIVSPTANQLDNSIHIFSIWVGIISVIGWILFELILELGAAKIKDISFASFSSSPCRKCKFYNRNLFLKCAVHPNRVLTKQATNCIDYCNKHHEVLD